MKRKIVLLLCSVVPLLAAQPTLTLSGPANNVKAGSSITLNLALATNGGAPQAIQFTLAGMPWPATAVIGAAGTAAGKAIQCNQVGSSLACIVAGLNASVIGDGVLGSFAVTLPRNTSSGTNVVNLSNLLAAQTDASGNVTGLAVASAGPLSLSTISLCNVANGASITQVDLDTVDSTVIGKTACSPTTDLNSDGACSIIDSQIVANAAITGVCAAK